MCIPVPSQHLWQQRSFFKASIEVWQNVFPEFIDTQLQTAAQLARFKLIVRSMSTRIKAIFMSSISPQVHESTATSPQSALYIRPPLFYDFRFWSHNNTCMLFSSQAYSVSTTLWSPSHTCILYSPLQPCFYSNRWVINFIYWQKVTYTPALRAIIIYSAVITYLQINRGSQGSMAINNPYPCALPSDSGSLWTINPWLP